MKKVRRKDTAPELAVRRFLHGSGLRFRIHVRKLPGTPDIVLPRYGAVVFVHGCFWHGHDCKHGSVLSKTRADFWSCKIAANRARDARKALALASAGWRVLTFWECQVSRAEDLGRLCVQLRNAER